MLKILLYNKLFSYIIIITYFKKKFVLQIYIYKRHNLDKKIKLLYYKNKNNNYNKK